MVRHKSRDQLNASVRKVSFPHYIWQGATLTADNLRGKTRTLAQVLFPLGGLTKPEVRSLAAEAGLPVAHKRESMGVCFVGKRRSWADFISQYITPSPGKCGGRRGRGGGGPVDLG